MRKSLAVAIVLFAAVAPGLASGAGRSWSVRFNFVPQRAFQGQPAAISVLVKPANARCTLAVRYVDGTIQDGLGTTHAVAGRAGWKWSLSQNAPAGLAKASVQCGRSGNLSRTFTVVGGSISHVSLSVVTSGYSQRPDRYGAGSSVSYGVVLNNPSDIQDAQNVSVQVNFIDSTNHTLETTTNQISAIGANSTFNLGGSESLPTQTPVVKLELIVQTGAWVKHDFHEPALDNVHIVPSGFDPDYVGEVDGDLVNDHPTDTLTNASAYIVLYDAAGNVVGGGTGFLFASLPPGTRSYFSATSGFSAVPMAKASTAAISIVPTYKAPGT
jgi:hypothetical protein